MVRKSRLSVAAATVLILVLVVAAGCTSYRAGWGGVVPDNRLTREHARPIGGDYRNFDKDAVTLEVIPVEDTNPVQTQHILIATVEDAKGNPLHSRRVEWMITNGVGAIVEVDESGWYSTRGYKVDNRYAITHTNRNGGELVLTRGNDDPKDDVVIKEGQTWCVITSAIEGDTHMAVYAPGIYSWDKHKVFVVKHWRDAAWEFPPEATNPIGVTHTLTTRVMTYSTKSPLKDYEVTYRIVSGPDATLSPGTDARGVATVELTGPDTTLPPRDGKVATVKTDARGLATVELRQVKPVEGVNEVQIDVVRPTDGKPGSPAIRVAIGMTRKTWIGPKIGIVKSAPATAMVGQSFDYTIVVSNPSKVATTNTVLTDTLPNGITYVSSSPEAKVAGQNLSWSLGRLAAGGRSNVKVTVKGTKTGKFTNTAKVAADFGLSGEATAVTVIKQAALQVTKSAPAEVLICEPISYTFTVTNKGDAPATNVKLEDKLPEGLLYQGRSTITADLGTLAPGKSEQVQYSVNATRTGAYTNTVDITGDGGLKVSAEAKTVVRQPVLAIVKDAPRARFVGRDITYTITVTNKGDGVAKNCVVRDSVPAGCAFVSASDGVTPAAGKLSWNLGDLAPEASKKVTFTVMPQGIGNIENLVTVDATCAKASAKAVTAVAGIPAILLECADEADPIEVGAQETYTIMVTNQGSAPDTNVVVKCTLPAEQQFVSASGPTKETVAGQVVTFAPLKSLAPKATTTYKVVVKALAVGDARFTISLTSDQLKTPVQETESTNQYPD